MCPTPSIIDPTWNFIFLRRQYSVFVFFYVSTLVAGHCRFIIQQEVLSLSYSLSDEFLSKPKSCYNCAVEAVEVSSKLCKSCYIIRLYITYCLMKMQFINFYGNCINNTYLFLLLIVTWPISRIVYVQQLPKNALQTV